jgi:hypothetical protein
MLANVSFGNSIELTRGRGLAGVLHDLQEKLGVLLAINMLQMHILIHCQRSTRPRGLEHRCSPRSTGEAITGIPFVRTACNLERSVQLKRPGHRRRSAKGADVAVCRGQVAQRGRLREKSADRGILAQERGDVGV